METSPAKIMLIIPAGQLTGPMKGVLQLIENSGPAEFDLRLYGFQFNDAEESPLVRSLRERGIPVKQLVQKNRSYWSLSRQVIREIRENDYDILQTHGFKPTFLGFVAKLSCRAKWICFMHGTTNENMKVRMYNWLDSVLQRWADRTVLVSNAQRKKILGGQNTKRVQVLHNAVDIKNPMPMSPSTQSVQEQLAIGDGDKIIVAVGRLSPEKGTDVLLEAFALLTEDRTDVHLVLVGDGQERTDS
jgi:glycosyltransferase involved in cell wall biosynthesis